MIPAIDPGIGLKEDSQMPQAPSGAGNDRFAKALKRAGGPSDSATSRPSTSRRSTERPPPGDSRMRSRFGQEPDEAPDGEAKASAREQAPAEGEPVAGEETIEGTQTLNEAAGQAGNPQFKSTDEAFSATELTGEGEAAASLALTAVEEAEVPGAIGNQTPIDAQIGSAAWRLSPHGKAEGDAAVAAGTVLPGSTEAELARMADLNQARNALFAEGEEVDDPAQGQRLTRQEEAAAVLNLSEAGKGKGKEKGVSIVEQVKLEAAQSRNQLLSQLAAGGEQAAGEGLETEVAQNFLRQRLQANGLLHRGASAVVKPSSEEQPLQPILAGATGSSAMEATRLFQASAEEAVQQRAIDQVAHEARWLITNRKNEVTLRLYPDHLGDVNMKVVHKDGLIRIEMTVDTLVAKQMLESNMDGLRDRLMEDNLADEFQFDVNVRKDHQESELQGQAQQEMGPHGSRLDSLSMAADSSPERRVLNHSGLSIYA